MKTVEPRAVLPAEIGMAVKQVEEHFKGMSIDGDPAEGCFIANSEKPALSFMFEDGKLTRIYVSDPDYPTDKGIRVGSTEDDVKAAYGSALDITPNRYDESWNEMMILDGAGYGIVFETDGKVVQTISVGEENAIQYVEGCS